jgi:hypothetical protein
MISNKLLVTVCEINLVILTNYLYPLIQEKWEQLYFYAFGFSLTAFSQNKKLF